MPPGVGRSCRPDADRLVDDDLVVLEHADPVLGDADLDAVRDRGDGDVGGVHPAVAAVGAHGEVHLVARPRRASSRGTRSGSCRRVVSTPDDDLALRGGGVLRRRRCRCSSRRPARPRRPVGSGTVVEVVVGASVVVVGRRFASSGRSPAQAPSDQRARRAAGAAGRDGTGGSERARRSIYRWRRPRLTAPRPRAGRRAGPPG